MGRSRVSWADDTGAVVTGEGYGDLPGCALVIMRKRERVDDDLAGDSSSEDRDAATTLSKLSHGFPGFHTPEGRLETRLRHVRHKSRYGELKGPVLAWTGTRKRSDRGRRIVSSNDDLQLSALDNPSLLPQGSECSSSPVGDSQSVVTLVNAEEEPCSSEEERCRVAPVGPLKLLSDSSDRSPQSESPSSPLPAPATSFPSFDEFQSLPNFAESLSEKAKGCHKVAPVRPVKKPKACRSLLKVEQSTLEAPKVEPADVRSIVPQAETVKFDPSTIKVESKVTGRPGQRIGGKPKPALSESEKEARKQRRVQANRESARQTIRRKQELCEDLSKRAQLLTVENETIRKEVERLRQATKNLLEGNAHLRNQVEKCAANKGPSSTSTAHSPKTAEKAALSFVQYTMPSRQFARVGWPPQIWQWGLPSTTTPELASAVDAAAAGMVATAMGVTFGSFCFGAAGQVAVFPPYFPTLAASTLSSPSANTPANFSPLLRTVSLPDLVHKTPPLPSSIETACNSSKSSSAVYRAGNFADSSFPSPELKTSSGIKCETIPQESNLDATFRRHILSTNAAEPESGVAGVRGSAIEGTGTMPCQVLNRAHSLGASSQVQKVSGSQFGTLFTPGGAFMQCERPSLRESDAQRAAAAATEARRRRRALTRTKSLQQHRLGARLTEPSAS